MFNEKKWATIEKCSEYVGLSKEAIRAHKKKGEWREQIHWMKRNGRIFINIENVQRWIEGRAPKSGI